MSIAPTYLSTAGTALKAKVQDYGQLMKFRLSLTVVFSSVMAYAIASYAGVDAINLLWLFVGGFAVTGASNALNQVLEKDPDKLMKRTMNRPVATGRMGVPEAVLVAGILGTAGISLLWYVFNPAAALLGGLSLLTYSFIYTPLKRISPVAVFVGAIPGAMPPLIGWVAATGSINSAAIVLFTIQFLWQFPHFWAIAWIGDEDYRKAGFRLLPSKTGKDKFTALQSILYVVALIPVSLLPLWNNWINGWAALVILAAGLFYLQKAVKLFRTCEDADALKLMFASIIYLPVVLTAILLGRII